MNVIFFTSGEGFGHIARDLAVADALKRRGHDVTICTYGAAAQKAMAESDFKVADIPRYSMAIEAGGRLNVIKSVTHSIIPLVLLPFSALKASFMIKKYAADAIVVDEYLASLPAAALSGKRVFFVTNCLNPAGGASGKFAALWERMPLIERIGMRLSAALQKAIYADVGGRISDLLICDYSPPNTVAKYNCEGFAKKLSYTGPQARESPDKLDAVEKIKKKLGLGKFILVTRGKYGEADEISKILEDMSKLTKKHRVVVMGRENRLIGDVIIRKFEYHEYLDYLKACDLVITHGGHSTMMECCIFGKPMVLIVAGNYWERMGNARGAEELGIAELIPFPELTATTLHAAVDRMLKKRKTSIQKFKALAKKENGAERAADMIELSVTMEELKKKQQE